MTQIRIRLGALAIGALFGAALVAGCSSSSDATNDAATSDSAVDETPVVADAGDETPAADTATPTTEPGFDYSGDTTTTQVRFAVAVADFPDGTNFDICWSQANATCSSIADSDWQGPLASSVGAANFTSPEVTDYYAIGTAGQPLCVRLVTPGSSCAAAARFTLSTGGSVKVTDDISDMLNDGYTTGFVFGSVSGGTAQLTDVVTGDPAAVATSPTIQLFNGIVNTPVTPGGGISVAYGAIEDIAASSTVTLGDGVTASFDLGVNFDTAYYVGIAFGDPTNTASPIPEFYLCWGGVAAATSAGTAANSNCHLYTSGS